MLTNVNLGGTEGANQIKPGVVSLPLTFPLWPPSPDRYTQWEAVAQTCQDLPRLKGVWFQAPSVGVLRTVLGLFAVEDLVECGMNVRDNCLAPRLFTDIWEQLESLGQ